MVFVEFIRKSSVFLISCFFLLCHFDALAERERAWPIFAAQISDSVLEYCQIERCDLNLIDKALLEQLFEVHPNKEDVFDSLTLSEYELLVSSAVKINKAASQTLVLEMTTSWRGVPIDDFNVETTIDSSLTETAATVINRWVNRAQSEDVFDAKRIYDMVGASDYSQHLQLPEKIGEFVLIETALYHDPMLGSISRYKHPKFADAVVDVSVYPISPFVHPKSKFAPLQSEMEIEKSHISTLIEQAKLDDYYISDIQSARFTSALGNVDGLSLEVALQTKIDPVYSTQFLFTQNDKFIKLTGNVPKHMMLALVQESIGQIRVPHESSFMQSMRH
jgi:hypothetical protein